MYQRKTEYARIDYKNVEWYWVYERLYIDGKWEDWVLIGTFKYEDLPQVLYRG